MSRLQAVVAILVVFDRERIRLPQSLIEGHGIRVAGKPRPPMPSFMSPPSVAIKFALSVGLVAASALCEI